MNRYHSFIYQFKNIFYYSGIYRLPRNKQKTRGDFLGQSIFLRTKITELQYKLKFVFFLYSNKTSVKNFKQTHFHGNSTIVSKTHFGNELTLRLYASIILEYLDITRPCIK